MKNKKKFSTAAIVIFHIIILLITYFPIYFMIISSFKTNAQIISSYFLPSLPLHFENYVAASEKVLKYLGNSLLICGGSVVGIAVCGLMSAYVFARFKFPGKNALFMFIISFLMIPAVLTLIPRFVMVNRLELINTYWACILPYIAGGQIMFIMIIRSFIEGLPGDLFDAAKIDGAGHFRIVTQIVVPLSKQIVVSLLLVNFLGNWNDFIWPQLTLIKDNLRTVTVGLYAFTDVQQVQYGHMFAGFVVASVPMIILFSLNMKNFVNGITVGAVKG